ncbi:SpvB/TcaC N-terminal domain-containing protein [Actinopolymorpha singaporensis]
MESQHRQSGTSSPTTPPPSPISLPQGGGAIRGIGEKFGADPVTGSGSLTIPVPTSEGRAGFGPHLVLGYDSGAGNGPFGFGWRMPVATISRKTEQGLPQYRDAEESDVFLLSGSEDLVPMTGADGEPVVDTVSVPGFSVARYRPRIESDYARIERWTSTADGDVHWRTLSAENVLAVYGRTAESRIADPADARRVHSWLLSETRDDRGNAVLYRYKQEDAEGVDVHAPHETGRTHAQRVANRYLKDVRYGNRVPLLDAEGRRPVDLTPVQVEEADFLLQVVLDYGEHSATAPTPDGQGDWLCRNDPFSTYRPGFEVRTYRLCQRVLMFHHFPEPGVGPDTLVRSLDLSYRSNRGAPDDVRLGAPLGAFVDKLTQRGYVRAGAGYTGAEYPALELTYSEAVLGTTVRELDEESRANLPTGVDDLLHRWADLDGDGLAGVLTEQAGGWYYKPNLGGGQLGPLQPLATQPSQASLHSGRQQLLDVTGEGRVDLVQLAGEPAGYTARTADRDWRNFVPFHSLPTIDWTDPRLLQIDLTGDGRADLLLTDDNIFTWYPSLGAEGYGAAQRTLQRFEDERSPRLVSADREQVVSLADMSGDGLMDVIRVRDGEVCYWPNLGYGRFGARIVMDAAPRFGGQFDPRRLRLADVDGSGCVDLIYLDGSGVRLWSNEAGNGWSAPQWLPDLPHLDDRCTVQVVDLLGTGTACLVWSSPAAVDAPSPIRYVELMRDGKPHLLVETVNNLGARTRVGYVPSTRFLVEDRRAGHDWATRLPFPVHVVARTEQVDLVSRTRFTSKYSYAHGYFDSEEREFRGFARVTQQDTEAFEDYVAGTLHEDAGQDLAPEVYQAPVTTRTWFHTGAYLEREAILHQLREEYYGGASDTPEPLLPAGMTEAETRECLRALRGRPLRQEVYSYDGSPEEDVPYSVVEYGHEVRRLQPRTKTPTGADRHGVFAAHLRETLTRHVDRDATDERVTHKLELEVGPYGNVLRSASVVYGRTTADPDLPVEVTREQQRLRIQYGETDYTPDVDRVGPVPAYRLRAPYETRGFEVTGIAPAATRFTVDDLDAKLATTAPIGYEDTAGGTDPERRLLTAVRTLFRDDQLAPLPLGQRDSLGLDHETYRLAFTPGTVTAQYAGAVSDDDFTAAGYVHLGDANWWLPSGTMTYSADPAARFYLPTGARDALGLETVTTLDDYALLVTQTSVPSAPWQVVSAVNDYRVLSAQEVTDPNGNRTAVAFDALGFVVRSAVLGKEAAPSGDTLDEPTAQMDYELFRWRDSQLPNRAHVRTREQHGPENPRWQESYVYSNGSGGVAMAKTQAPPGPVRQVGPDNTPIEPAAYVTADPRWVATGRTVLNNKGNPVKQYEPFFSPTADYEDEEAARAIGVTAIAFYDPVGRNTSTRHPDGTLSRTEFGPWRRRDWDAADTVLDADWYAERGSPDPTAAEPADPQRRAAWLSAQHAGTPSTTYVDNLGRPAYAVSDHGGGVTTSMRSESDLTGRVFAVYDQLQRRISSGFVGMLGQPVYVEDAETGSRWTFVDVLGAVVRAWDDTGRTWRTAYDALHRPVGTYFTEPGRAEVQCTFLVYGDRAPDAARHNLLGAAHLIFDAGGLTRVDDLDLHGNPLTTDRLLLADVTTDPDWKAAATAANYPAILTAAAAELDPQVWTVTTTYDALSRPRLVTLPDGTRSRPTYDEANFLARMEVQPGGTGAFGDVLVAQTYDAKGRRQTATYGNDVVLTYTYDPATFRLTDLLAAKAGAPVTQALARLHYTYDAVGNVVEVADDAQQTHFFRNAVVRPDRRYAYDALYQLVRASGRELAGGVNDTTRDARDLPMTPQLPFENDAAAVRTWTEEYDYDLLGNLTELRHRFATQPGIGNGWTRRYRYAYQEDATDRTNRLAATSLPADPAAGPYSATYDYDGDGHLTRMPHLAHLTWNAFDRLREVDLGTGGTAYYQYDSGGARVRKTIVRQDGTRQDWLYLGPLEVYRERTGAAAPHLERHTVNLADDAGPVAQFDVKTVDSTNAEPAVPLNVPLLRYRYTDAVGSSVLETDADGAVLSYQEYAPYGTTTFRNAKVAPGVHPQRYRFAGNERDDETGLDCMGARYYAPWLGRWTAADPAGFADGPNRWSYCRNNPTMLADPTGTQSADPHSVVHVSPATARLLRPENKAEAQAYLERVYTSRLREEFRGQRFVIDRMHLTSHGWIIDESHLEPIAPAGDGSGPPGVTGGVDSSTGDPTARPDAVPADGGSAAGTPTATATTGTQQTDGGSTTGSSTGTRTEGPPGGSSTGSATGTAGGRGTESNPGGGTGTEGTGSGGGPPRERTFWDRGGRVLLLGLGIVALGLLTVATGGGALVMFAAGMAIGAGTVAAVGGAALLTASYAGYTTAEQDARWQGALTDAALVASSPGSAIGGAVGYAVNGREGMRTGAMIGGLTEGVISLGVGGARALMRPGPGLNPAPVGEVALAEWRQMSALQRSTYELGQTTVRARTWAQIVARGIETNPIAKGEFLRATYGGRLGILFRAWAPFTLVKTVSTGGTPMAAYAGSWLVHGFGLTTATGFNWLTNLFNDSATSQARLDAAEASSPPPDTLGSTSPTSPVNDHLER